MPTNPSSQPLDPIRWKVVEPGKPTAYFDTWDEARQYCQAFAPKSIPEAAETEPGTGGIGGKSKQEP
jgi:hypothetical protein